MKKIKSIAILAIIFSLFLAVVCQAAESPPSISYPRFKAFDTNGNPLSGGKVYTYDPGTSTPRTTYTDSGLTTPAANPVVLNSNGEATIYVNGDTDFTLKTSSGSTLWGPITVRGLYTLLPADLPAATTSAQGAVELATDAETLTGTDTARATTPSNIAALITAKKDAASGLAGLDASTRLKTAEFPAGSVVQVQNFQTGAMATGSTVLPVDNTTPQNTEGDQYMSLAFTPLYNDSKLKIEVNFIGASSVNNYMTAALFQDTTANALACGYAYNVANYEVNLHFTHWMTSGTTSATTFKVRAGGHNAGTTTFNGHGGGAYFNGTIASSITITEIRQ